MSRPLDLEELDTGIDGVFDVHQQRSRELRNAFVEAGFVLLNTMQFKDMKIADLAQQCGRSVGSFYKRFEDKDAYFRALRMAAVAINRQIADERLDAATLRATPPPAVIDIMVDLLADIFSGRTRGLLRESLIRILEPEDAWAPMRDSGREVLRRVTEAVADRLPGHDEDAARRKLAFCYQIVVGVLQNDLVNGFHVFSTRDESLRRALKTTLHALVDSDARY
jgi:Transcriptional regulator